MNILTIFLTLQLYLHFIFYLVMVVVVVEIEVARAKKEFFFLIQHSSGSKHWLFCLSLYRGCYPAASTYLLVFRTRLTLLLLCSFLPVLFPSQTHCTRWLPLPFNSTPPPTHITFYGVIWKRGRGSMPKVLTWLGH